MKKMVYRLFTLVLASMMIASMFISVSAAEYDSAIDYMPIELENGIEAGSVIGSRLTGLPFTMRAANVTTLLSTKNYGKGFVPRDYVEPDASVLCSGKFTHSYGNVVKAGICYYDDTIREYVPANRAAQIVEQNKQFYLGESFYDLRQTTTYYGYVKNITGVGAVDGGSMTVSKAFG